MPIGRHSLYVTATRKWQNMKELHRHLLEKQFYKIDGLIYKVETVYQGSKT